jgi:hypothetical protein
MAIFRFSLTLMLFSNYFVILAIGYMSIRPIAAMKVMPLKYSNRLLHKPVSISFPFNQTELKASPLLIADNRWRSRNEVQDFNKDESNVSFYLILANIIIAMATAVDSSLLKRFAKVNYLIGRGENYRLLTSTFLHGDLQHLFSNCLSLYNVGFPVSEMSFHIFYSLTNCWNFIGRKSFRKMEIFHHLFWFRSVCEYYDLSFGRFPFLGWSFRSDLRNSWG